MTRRRSVVFDGYYGMRNCGDDAFCVVATEIAHEHWRVADIAFIGPSSQLPRTSAPVRGLFPEPPRFRGHGRLAPIPAMLSARQVVHVGGSTFMRPLRRHRDEARLASLGLIDLHAVGISVGPFEDAEAAAAVGRVLNAFTTVSVRDAASLDRIDQLSVDVEARLSFDPGVLLADEAAHDRRAKRRSTSRPVLGVSLCAHEARRNQDPTLEERRYSSTAAVVAEVARRTGARVHILVFNDHPHWGDHELSQRLRGHLGGDAMMTVRDRDPRTLLRATEACDAVIATRLHSAVFAYALGVPFAMVAYQQKNLDFATHIRLPSEVVFCADGSDLLRGTDLIVSLLDGGSPLSPALPLTAARLAAREAFPDPTQLWPG